MNNDKIVLFENKNPKKLEDEMIEQFCQYHASSLIHSDSEEIIQLFLDWEYQRYKMMSNDQVYAIVDIVDPINSIMFFSKNNKYTKEDILKVCDDLNHCKSEKDKRKMDFLLLKYNYKGSELLKEADLTKDDYSKMINKLLNIIKEE